MTASNFKDHMMLLPPPGVLASSLTSYLESYEEYCEYLENSLPDKLEANGEGNLLMLEDGGRQKEAEDKTNCSLKVIRGFRKLLNFYTKKRGQE